MEVAVFFKRDRGISRPARVYFFATLFGSGHCGNGRRLRKLGPVKYNGRAESDESDHRYDDERKNAFQGCPVEEKVE